MSLNRLANILGISVAILVCLIVSGQAAGAPLEDEARVKTAYIFNFCKYITWPESDRRNLLDICLLGGGPLTEYLPVLEKKKVHGSGVKVNLSGACFSKECCNVVFISRKEREELSGILNALAGQPVLTISDLSQFAELGGMIQLIRHGSKIRFIINKKAVDESGLVISSRLLKLAVRVVGDGE